MIEILQSWGLIGLFLGTFLAATVVPFSSDILLMGYLYAGGDYFLSFLVATIGNWLGGLTSYWIGYSGKWEWIEKWFNVKEETLIKQKGRIDRFGALLAFLSWLPFIGDVFAIGLGFYKVSPTKSAIYMLIGKAIRFAFWILIFLLI